MKDWTGDYFTEEYLLKYRPRQEGKQTRDEVTFLIKALGLKIEDKVLDIACGYGRHVNELWKRGITAYGIDNNPLYIEEAKKGAGHFDIEDMRTFYLLNMDHAYCFFTSFGYFNDLDNQKVLDHAAAAIKSKFLIHLRNREWLMRNFVENQWDSYADHTELTKRNFNLLTSRMETEIVYWPSGKKVTQSIRFYTLAEITGMFKKAGLRVKNVYGGIDFSEYHIDSEWCIVIGEKI
jgi:SAM-dependent methyltransferase